MKTTPFTLSTKYRFCFSIIFLFFLFSCKMETKEEKMMKELKIQQMVDSIMGESDKSLSNAVKKVLFDTVGVSQAPVKIFSSKLSQGEYSEYRNLQLTYQNVSDKVVEGIRFRWYGETVFGEPADMGGTELLTGTKGFGQGVDDKTLSIGKKRDSEWPILSKDAKKIVLAWPIEVVYADGTKWEVDMN